MRESLERAMEGSARGDGGQPVDPAANGVSKHPVASIPTTDLSFADIERSRSHPVRWACYIIAVLAAILAHERGRAYRVAGQPSERLRAAWRGAGVLGGHGAGVGRIGHDHRGVA